MLGLEHKTQLLWNLSTMVQRNLFALATDGKLLFLHWLIVPQTDMLNNKMFALRVLNSFFHPVGNPDQNFRAIPQCRWLFLASHLTGILSIPNLASILCFNHEFRASNKGNPGSPRNLLGTLCFRLKPT